MKVWKCNKFIIGLIIGLLLPPITAYWIYVFSYKGDYDFNQFLEGLITLKSLGKLISISVIPNLAFFMIVISYEKLLVARGLVFATAFWLLAVVVIRFFL